MKAIILDLSYGEYLYTLVSLNLNGMSGAASYSCDVQVVGAFTHERG